MTTQVDLQGLLKLIIDGKESDLVPHAWENDERADGMPTRFCRACSAYELTGPAGMGPRFGPLVLKSTSDGVCEPRTIRVAIEHRKYVPIAQQTLDHAFADRTEYEQTIQEAGKIFVLGVLQRQRDLYQWRPIKEDDLIEEVQKYDPRFTKKDIFAVLKPLTKDRTVSREPGYYSLPEFGRRYPIPRK